MTIILLYCPLFYFNSEEKIQIEIVLSFSSNFFFHGMNLFLEPFYKLMIVMAIILLVSDMWH